MLGSDVLEVAIGLALLFLFVSLICTAACEGIEAILKSRAKDLERGIRELLNDPDGSTITKTLYEHPLVYSLFGGAYNPDDLKKTRRLTGTGDERHMAFLKRRNLPSYIPASSFAAALIDIVARGAVSTMPYPAPRGNPLSMDKLRASASALPNAKLQRAMLSAIDLAQGDIEALKKNLEAWYDATMDRVSGWYKRRTHGILFAIGIAAAAVLNIDAIHIAHRLAQDKTLRTAVVAQAEKVIPESKTGDAAKDLQVLQGASFEQLRSQVELLGLPIGYPPPQLWCPPQASDTPADPAAKCETARSLGFGTAVTMALGWLITALAIMLGAPFWFDLLNKFMVIRSTVKPHEKSREEGSEDRQDPSTSPAPAGHSPAAAGSAAGQPAASDQAAVEVPFEPHTWGDGTDKGII